MNVSDALDPSDLQASAAQAARLLRALSNEARLSVLCRLSSGEQSVGELQRHVGLSQSALSQHLARLRQEGLVATRREGQTIFYQVADPNAVRVIERLVEIFCPTPESAR
jgi:ArsR family transcriptional regulator, virulence genes transcriptional regulator